MSAPEPYTPEPGAILTLAERVPEGWECRRAGSPEWVKCPTRRWIPDSIVEARPIPKPPLMVEIPREVAVHYAWNEWPSGSTSDAVAGACRAALTAESES